MSAPKGFSSKIIRIYLLGASLLLMFYVLAFHGGVLMTENTVMERRINIAAPFHFKRFSEVNEDVIKIDPLLTIYRSHTFLPTYIQSKVPTDWTGSMHVLLEDEKEFQVFAQRGIAAYAGKTFYAVEDSNPVEWDDTNFILTEMTLVMVGVLLFFVTSIYMTRAARKIASPFHYVSEKLEEESVSNFEQIDPPGERTKELTQILKSLNLYRARLGLQIEREQSFTRYVSHELRTPMMIVKGALSNLRQQFSDAENKLPNKSLDKIAKATDQMQELTQTFLMLAREEDFDSEATTVDGVFISQVASELESVVSSHEVSFEWQIQDPFQLNAHPQLVKAIILNLVKNAFACSVKGSVSLMINSQSLDVIDTGVGLNAKPRGYEGFGIGLVLVEDICTKYGWQFSLIDNTGPGCTATVQFAPLNSSEL